MEKLKSVIREVPDFPSPGISFKDITPLLSDPGLYHEIIEALAAPYLSTPVDYVAGLESRGFLFGMGLAQRLNAGFIPIRKAGKLPRPTYRKKYSLEYGEACIEVHREDLKPGDAVLIHDDLLATGGTAQASHELLSMAGADFKGYSFLIELSFLQGHALLQKHGPVHSLVQY